MRFMAADGLRRPFSALGHIGKSRTASLSPRTHCLTRAADLEPQPSASFSLFTVEFVNKAGRSKFQTFFRKSCNS